MFSKVAFLNRLTYKTYFTGQRIKNILLSYKTFRLKQTFQTVIYANNETKTFLNQIMF